MPVPSAKEDRRFVLLELKKVRNSRNSIWATTSFQRHYCKGEDLESYPADRGETGQQNSTPQPLALAVREANLSLYCLACSTSTYNHFALHRNFALLFLTTSTITPVAIFIYAGQNLIWITHPNFEGGKINLKNKCLCTHNFSKSADSYFSLHLGQTLDCLQFRKNIKEL